MQDETTSVALEKPPLYGLHASRLISLRDGLVLQDTAR
jgi:hypothetical protein